VAGPPGIEPEPEPTVLGTTPSLSNDEILKGYYDFCVVNRSMQPRVAKDYRQIARRFLVSSKGIVSEEKVREYLSCFLEKKPKTFNNQLEGLRSFVGRYLNRMDIMNRFKRKWQPSNYERVLPSKRQIAEGFEALESLDEKALYLLYATSGLRKTEALGLNVEDVQSCLRCVKPRHDTRTKKAGVTFYNEECASYIDQLKPKEDRIFRIGKKRFKRVWNIASARAGIRITPQVLRVWHSTELGELGIPDRYVDVFQGRAPKSMIARFYTGKELQRLKRIYDKAKLKVLT
jgi:integrase